MAAYLWYMKCQSTRLLHECVQFVELKSYRTTDMTPCCTSVIVQTTKLELISSRLRYCLNSTQMANHRTMSYRMIQWSLLSVWWTEKCWEFNVPRVNVQGPQNLVIFLHIYPAYSYNLNTCQYPAQNGIFSNRNYIQPGPSYIRQCGCRKAATLPPIHHLWNREVRSHAP